MLSASLNKTFSSFLPSFHINIGTTSSNLWFYWFSRPSQCPTTGVSAVVVNAFVSTILMGKHRWGGARHRRGRETGFSRSSGDGSISWWTHCGCWFQPVLHNWHVISCLWDGEYKIAHAVIGKSSAWRVSADNYTFEAIPVNAICRVRR